MNFVNVFSAFQYWIDHVGIQHKEFAENNDKHLAYVIIEIFEFYLRISFL